MSRDFPDSYPTERKIDFEIAQEYLEKKKYVEAERFFLEFTKLHNISGLKEKDILAEGYFNAGKACILRNDHKKAKIYLKKAIATYPDPEFSVVLGDICFRRGEYNDAFKNYTNAILNKNNYRYVKDSVLENNIINMTFAKISYLYKLKGDLKRADRHYLKAFQKSEIKGALTTSFKEALYQRFEARIKIYKGDLKNAKIALDKGLSHNKQDTELKELKNKLQIFERIYIKILKDRIAKAKSKSLKHKMGRVFSYGKRLDDEKIIELFNKESLVNNKIYNLLCKDIKDNASFINSITSNVSDIENLAKKLAKTRLDIIRMNITPLDEKKTNLSNNTNIFQEVDVDNADDQSDDKSKSIRTI